MKKRRSIKFHGGEYVLKKLEKKEAVKNPRELQRKK